MAELNAKLVKEAAHNLLQRRAEAGDLEANELLTKLAKEAAYDLLRWRAEAGDSAAAAALAQLSTDAGGAERSSVEVVALHSHPLRWIVDAAIAGSAMVAGIVTTRLRSANNGIGGSGHSQKCKNAFIMDDIKGHLYRAGLRRALKDGFTADAWDTEYILAHQEDINPILREGYLDTTNEKHLADAADRFYESVYGGGDKKSAVDAVVAEFGQHYAKLGCGPAFPPMLPQLSVVPEMPVAGKPAAGLLPSIVRGVGIMGSKSITGPEGALKPALLGTKGGRRKSRTHKKNRKQKYRSASKRVRRARRS